ncbi:chaoptin-like [Chelonus insularis]|uniref:chaoptin-like n=1 Tax=Chelonus insularis TaxID=460826 RepID=UPI0015898507|nr:chaoptin-like [Chelonus insularis]
MYSFLFIILVNYLQITSASVCDICSCFTSGTTQVSNCSGKLIDYNGVNLNIFPTFFAERIPDKLILSSNNISQWESPILINNFKNFEGLKELDLSFNDLKTLDISFYCNVSIRELNVSHNLIDSFIETLSINNNSSLKHFDLSYNQLQIINKTTFQHFPQLEFLDLSFNLIKSIETQAFQHFRGLNFLKLNNNYLTSFVQSISAVSLKLDNNFITSLDLLKVNDLKTQSRLNYLNVSKNQLTSIMDSKLMNLHTLDISYNNLSKIPSSINSKNFPNLDTLIVSGNPLNILKFDSDIKLKNFIADNINLLNTIDKDVFDYLKTYPNDCINISISFNKNLKSVNEEWLDNLRICYLDLSHNSLEKITPRAIQLTDTSFPKYGINLQHNPFICDCNFQWVLDSFIPKLYSSHSMFLADLRCSKPLKLSNMRIIHWYNWKTKVFCNHVNSESVEQLEKLVIYEDVNINNLPISSTVSIKPRKSVLVLIIAATVSLTVITIAGLFMSHKLLERRRRQNRRF